MASELNVLRALRHPGQEYPFSADVVLEDMEFSGDPISFRDIKVEGIMMGAEERVSVRAEVAAVMKSHCFRCLEDVEMPIKALVDAEFAKVEDPDDPDLYVFEASTIELTDAVRDALVMEIPTRIICSEDCKGLCPSCGVNRNKVSCTCQEGGEVANPFAALKSIVLNDEEV